MTDQVALSKFLLKLLRHDPARYGILLDHEGYADLETVRAVLDRRFREPISDADFEAVVAGDRDGKKRLEVVEGMFIRALYGHSLADKITYSPAPPPEILFHGTVQSALASIQALGLLPGGRQYVHMTTDRAIAERVGRRHGRDFVLLVVQAQGAHEAGVVFYQPEARHFLADAIPWGYLLVGDR